MIRPNAMGCGPPQGQRYGIETIDRFEAPAEPFGSRVAPEDLIRQVVELRQQPGRLKAGQTPTEAWHSALS